MKNNTMMCAIFMIAVATANADTVAWWHFNGAAGEDATNVVSSVGGHTLTLNTLEGYPVTAYADDSRGDTLYVESGGTKTLLDVFARGCVSMKVTETGGTEQKGLFYTGDVSSILKHDMVDGVPHMRAFTIELYSKLSNTDAGLNFGLRNSKSPNTYSWALAFWLYSAGTQYRADSINADGSVTQGGSFAVKTFRGYTGDDKPFPSDGEWHHFAVVYDGNGTTTIYHDYKQMNQITDSPLKTDAVTFFLGPGGITGVNNPRDFTVDEVRISDSALTSDQFFRVGWRGFAEGAGGTLAHWTFDAPGMSGTEVGAEYGAINSADARPDLALCGATFTNGSEWATYWDQNGDFQPMFTNDVPAAFVWDAEAGKIYNPDNATSVFFRHQSEQGDSPQSRVGSSLHSASNFVYDVMAASNVTEECFIKLDKTFGNNNSAVMGLMRMLKRTDFYGGYSILTLTQGGTKPLVQFPNNEKTPNASSIADGNWHHVAMNFDVSSGTSVVTRLYVDYDYIGSGERVYDFSFVPEDLVLTFGAFNQLYAFSGMIDEPRITYGPADTNHFLRAFTPRENLTAAWLVQTNATLTGAEWFSPEVPYLTAEWKADTVTLDDALPFSQTMIRPCGKAVAVSKSVKFSGVGGVTIPCAALVGTNVFTMEANVCGRGTVFAKKRYGGTSWSVGTDSDGCAVLGVNDTLTASAVALDDGKWHHVALTVDRISANTATLYVDGVAVVSADVSDMVVDSGDFVVGGDFIGNIVGVRFSPGCLDPAEFMTVSRANGFSIIVR